MQGDATSLLVEQHNFNQLIKYSAIVSGVFCSWSYDLFDCYA